MNSSFSTILPTLQIAWDATSLSAYKRCPRYYYYNIVLGYTGRLESFHLTFGILYHQGLEIYDRARAEGDDHDRATNRAILSVLRLSWNKELSRPWMSLDSNKNRFNLIRTLVWYLEQFGENDAIETVRLSDGRPAVELSFRYPFPYIFSASTGERATICGHLDRVGNINGQFWIVDRKTTKHAIDDNYFKRYSPDNQMSAYSLAGRVVFGIPVQGVLVDAAQVMVGFSRFRRGFAHRTQSQLDEWSRDTYDAITRAEANAIEDYWPQNDQSCFNYGGCIFREVCSRSPEVREQILEQHYTKRIWDPLQVRGDV